MSILVIRHGLSQANNRESEAFGAATAPLMELGRQQARQAAVELRGSYKIEPSRVKVAVSELLRTQQTAAEMGFVPVRTRQYGLLNEIEHGLNREQYEKMRDAGRLPDAAMQRARDILRNPPVEDVWVAHGLVIAALCRQLGVGGFKSMVPKFCEIRKLPIHE